MKVKPPMAGLALHEDLLQCDPGIHWATMLYTMRNSFGEAAVPDDVQGSCVQHHTTRQQCYTSLAEPSQSGLESSQTLSEVICFKRHVTSTVRSHTETRPSILSIIVELMNVDGRSNPSCMDKQTNERTNDKKHTKKAPAPAPPPAPAPACVTFKCMNEATTAI